ncbi:MAG: histone H1, partial [Pseudomonadota bacterium]
MPKGPKGEKRPADVIGNAVRIAQIATGEVKDDVEDDGKDPAAKALGAKGGAARAKKLTPEQRSDIAKKAAAKRWSSKNKEG